MKILIDFPDGRALPKEKEPVWVLMGRDSLAPAMIDDWVLETYSLWDDDTPKEQMDSDKVVLDAAVLTADRMREFFKTHKRLPFAVSPTEQADTELVKTEVRERTVTAAALRVQKQLGSEPTRTLLRRFGHAETLAQVKPENRAEFLAALQAVEMTFLGGPLNPGGPALVRPADDFTRNSVAGLYTSGHLNHETASKLMMTLEPGERATAAHPAFAAPYGQPTLAERYPAYYRPCPFSHIDVYRVLQLFEVKDDSGALHHAIKKLLLAGVRTGGKPVTKDIEEARDTLNRYLEMQRETETAQQPDLI